MRKQIFRNFVNTFRFHLGKRNIHIGHGCNISGTSFLGFNRVGENTELLLSSCGKYTYFGQDCYFSRTEIGNFCSVADDVRLIVGTHPAHDWVSTSPAFYSTQKQCGKCFADTERFNEQKYADKGKMRYAIIGNDVWLCQGARIMSGVRVGDGAIVAAGALVVRDVPDFAIVGGVPAKFIGWRFAEEERKQLSELKWWYRDEAWLSENADAFSDIKKFLNTI